MSLKKTKGNKKQIKKNPGERRWIEIHIEAKSHNFLWTRIKHFNFFYHGRKQ